MACDSSHAHMSTVFACVLQVRAALSPLREMGNIQSEQSNTSKLGSKVGSRLGSPVKQKEAATDLYPEWPREQMPDALPSSITNFLVSQTAAPAKHLQGTKEKPILLERCCRRGECN